MATPATGAHERSIAVDPWLITALPECLPTLGPGATSLVLLAPPFLPGYPLLSLPVPLLVLPSDFADQPVSCSGPAARARFGAVEPALGPSKQELPRMRKQLSCAAWGNSLAFCRYVGAGSTFSSPSCNGEHGGLTTRGHRRKRNRHDTPYILAAAKSPDRHGGPGKDPPPDGDRADLPTTGKKRSVHENKGHRDLPAALFPSNDQSSSRIPVVDEPHRPC